MAGGLASEEEWSELGKVSLATLKSYWRTRCHALPFLHALDAADFNIVNWSPFQTDGAVVFAKNIKRKPRVLIELFGRAKAITNQINDLLDESAKRGNFMIFPSDLPEIEWFPKGLSKEQREISKSYRRLSL